MVSSPHRMARLFAYIRRRLRARRVLAVLFTWLLAVGWSGAALVLMADALGPSPLLRPLFGIWLTLAGVLGAAWLIHAARLHAEDESIASYLGRRVPDLRSDLISAVELCGHPAPGGPGGDEVASALLVEFHERTAAALSTLEIEKLTEVRTRSSVLLLAGLLASLGVLAQSVPAFRFQRGLSHLFQKPADETPKSSEPLLGDIRLLLSYPRYTGLPQRTIPTTSGDVLALPGTVVRVEARALIPVERAHIVLHTSDGEQTQRPVQLVRAEGRGGQDGHPLLVGGFTVSRAGRYHFVIERSAGDRIRESDGHRVDLEIDHPPRIDLFAPAEDLEIGSTRRVELAYSAEDDFGLGDIDLVFRVAEEPERRKRLRGAPPAQPGERKARVRTAAAKVEWDLSEIDLSPGVRVAYHLEARDQDDVSGPNVGLSRTCYLRISSPREKQEILLGKQEALLEQSIALLGDRIDAVQLLGKEGAPDLFERLLDVHRATEALLVELGRIQEEMPRDGALIRELRPALMEMGKRIGRLTQEEGLLLSELRKGRGADKDLKKGARLPRGRETLAMSERHVAELERDVILLDDLLGRQKLEELLAISDEMSIARDRLRQLLKDYKKAPSDALRQEIEREIRQLERRMAELQEKAQRLQGEIPDEFLNSEAMGQNDMQGRLDRLRDLLQKGDIESAQAELERLSQTLDNLKRGIESDLSGFRRERFTQEERALGEMENRLADLSHDQERIKRETEDLKSKASSRARQLVRDRAEGLVRRLEDKVVRLRRQVSDVEVGALGPWGSDEMEKTQKRVDDLSRMLAGGDLDEARAMAQEAEQSISRLVEELRAEEQATRFGGRSQLAKSRARLEQALPLAREIADEIGRALPRSADLLSPEDRKRISDLRGQQEALRRRVEQLGKDLGKRAREVRDAPLLERLSQEMGDGLHKAGGHMERAEESLKGLQPRSAAAEQGQALEKLGQLRKQMQQARRPRDDGSAARLERETVKIPGADEYRAPREFRQDILDAARREAPAEYREQVKRYYEELVK